MTPEDVAEIVEVPSSQVFNLLGSEPSPDAQDVDAENSVVSLGFEGFEGSKSDQELSQKCQGQDDVYTV